jgi:hypothetical protein
MSDKIDPDPAERALDIAKVGTGGLIGGALGGMGIGPAAMQATFLMVLEGVVQEVNQRRLSARERVRGDRVAALAITYFEEKHQLRPELRSDGFFEGGPGNRSFAEEIIEGVILVAQRQYQEKKIPYLAYLLANIPSDDGSRDLTNHLLRLADQLSYRQLCLMALFQAKDRYPTHVGKYLEAAGLSNEMRSLLGEFIDLHGRGLVDWSGGTDNAFLYGGYPDQGPGRKLYRLMELRRISDDDLAPLAERFRP